MLSFYLFKVFAMIHFSMKTHVPTNDLDSESGRWVGSFEVVAKASHALQTRGHAKTKWHRLTHSTDN